MQTVPQLQFSSRPDTMIMVVPGLSVEAAERLAQDAMWRARQRMPRVTGLTASRVSPAWGPRWFGLTFPREAWFMEKGTSAFTMRSLAGKTIPMWLTDIDGSLRRDNPKARVRSTDDGRTQVLIFRRAAKIGARVQRRSKWGNTYMAPGSYPGAPGRVNRRQPGAPWTPVGAQGGAIAAGNTGVKWRHPGVRSMQFLNSALAETAFDAGLLAPVVYVVDPSTLDQALMRKAA